MQKSQSFLRSVRIPWVLFMALVGILAIPTLQSEPVARENVKIPMRDGTRLAANLFLPDAKGRFPVILMRTPYGKGTIQSPIGRTLSRLGYALVIQDCRGRGDSEGTWDPFRYDVQDGRDTLRWVIHQPWCNGRVGTAGASYVGWTQWALAPDAPPELKTMVPMVPFADAYHHAAYQGGAFQLALCFGWGLSVGGVHLDPAQLKKAFRYLPLNRWHEQFHPPVLYLRDWIVHSTFDHYWRVRSIYGRYQNISCPILVIGGWYDIFSQAVFDCVDQVRRHAKNRLVRRNICLVVGPWQHGTPKRKLGELDFGPEAVRDPYQLQQQWLDYWLQDKETGVENWPPYLLFIMGENRWRGFSQWPPRNAVLRRFYLHSQGKANTLHGNGRLDLCPPSQDEPHDQFVYDPHNPVPTLGGNNLVALPSGPFDQTSIEQRPDVLVYTTQPFIHPLRVIGPVKLILYAASTAPDTDFTVKLLDVHPDGRAFNLCDGILRARYRNGDTQTQLIHPGQIYRYEIQVGVTANTFLPGHRLRIEVSSSNFPRFDRNPNTGHPHGTDTELYQATQTIYHDPAHPSHLLLYVLPPL